MLTAWCLELSKELMLSRTGANIGKPGRAKLEHPTSRYRKALAEQGHTRLPAGRAARLPCFHRALGGTKVRGLREGHPGLTLRTAAI